MEQAYAQSTKKFLGGEIAEGEYLVQIRYIFREVVAFRAKNPKNPKAKMPRFVAPEGEYAFLK